MIRFTIVLVSMAVLCVCLMLMAARLSWVVSVPSFFYQTLILLVTTNLVIYRYLIKIKRPDFFVQLYLLTIAVKLLAYGGYITWIIIDDKAGAIPNVAVFLMLYVAFTVVEIVFLYRKIPS
ncbi:MAG: hypothetical protein ABJA70_09580 [Chryseolinea sp.]